ncbi:MAG TPA: helix-turn-helix domain-containing protein [Terriglobales bacterium]|jgi:excisionase family DNA binding protein|nr:helix-turn-helix domain-containing protein [Terriglobales bacterium]
MNNSSKTKQNQSCGIADQIETMKSCLTVKNLAGLLGVHPQALYRQTHLGLIPHLRIGGMIRFDPKVTAKWLRDRSM